jgi:putative ABC transport system substrate-binding protein
MLFAAVHNVASCAGFGMPASEGRASSRGGAEIQNRYEMHSLLDPPDPKFAHSNPRRPGKGKYERFDKIVAQLVESKVDIIVGAGNPMAEAARRVTSTVPIVMTAVIEPVETGIVPSLARPGGNVTGFTRDAGSEIEGKRLQVLKEAIPGAARIAYMATKVEWEGPEGERIRTAAQELRVKLAHIEFIPTSYADAFPLIKRVGAQAMIASRNGIHFVHRRLIADFTLSERLPSMYAWREIVEAGGLMSYASDYADVLRRAAGYVDKILNGAKPADLPVEQPAKFELVINLKAAKALGLTIPPTLLASADEVIE